MAVRRRIRRRFLRETPQEPAYYSANAFCKIKKNSYSDHTASTFAVNIFSHDYKCKRTGKTYRIDFWDTAGQEQFNRMHPSMSF